MVTPRTLIATAAVSAVAAVTLGAGAVSAASAQTPDGSDLRPRIERACARIPNLQIRTDNLITRINGDAATIGSLAWLDVKIAQAAENEREQLVEVLTNRRAVRAATVPVLELRQTALADLAELCADYGVDV